MDGNVTRREFVKGAARVAAAAALGACAAEGAAGAEKGEEPASKILNHNENMEYRRLGKTGIKVSAVCLGGHWKRLQANGADFDKNRADVVSKCIEAGINYVDACTGGEVMAYAKALKGRRDKMYFGYSWYEHEMRFKDWQEPKKLTEGFDEGLQKSKLDYVDLWRITCFEPGSNHTFTDEETIVGALTKAKKAGKCRFCGISSHHRNWLKHMIESYPEIEVVLTPYTAGSKKKPEDSLFDAVKKHDAGLFGIKPFASGSVFRSRGEINPDTQKEDDERARLSLRYVLCNDALTAPIPGLISVEQVKNAALAVTERRQLDLADARRLERLTTEMWANLPPEYQWLKEWEWV